MKTHHLFWGILFVSIGLLWLLDRFMWINVEWDYLWKLWPVVIILWGVSLMIGNHVIRSIVTGITAFLLAFAIFTSVKYGFVQVGHGVEWSINNENNNYKYGVSDYSEPYNNSYSKASLHFSAGAGSFICNETTNELFSARAEGKKDNYSLTKTEAVDKVDLNFDMGKGHINFFHFNRTRNRVDFKLNTEPLWNLDFDLGAASVDFDLSPYKLKKSRLIWEQLL